MNALILPLSLALFVCSVVVCDDDAFAQGNLEVIFPAKSAKSSVDRPQMAEIPDLWCQARSHDSDDLLPIKSAHFIRHSDQEILPATIHNSRAILRFNATSIENVGKYRCEITTDDDRHVWGWLFVNVMPVFHTNSSKTYEIDEYSKYKVKSQTVRVIEGETVTLNCPVIGYPKPTVIWLKDNEAVASTEQITFLENDLEIDKVQFDNEGLYSCIALNTFPGAVDGEKQDWETRLDIPLKVKGSLRWVYPLIVIAVTLILLFIIIFSCSFCKRHKSYNVEKRERRSGRQNLGNASENISQQEPILGYGKNEIED